MARRDRPDRPDRGPLPDLEAIMQSWAKQGRTEPSAGLRSFAQMVRQMYVAMEQQGFTDEQALPITIALSQTMLANTFQTKPDQE